MVATRAAVAPAASRRAARRGGGLALVGVGLAAALLREWPPAQRLQLFAGGHGLGCGLLPDVSRDHGSIERPDAHPARAAFAWDTDTKPGIPVSLEDMVDQAASAVMRAYRQGHTRQAVRLRLDGVFDMEQIYLKGKQALLNASLPMMRSFTGRLWGGESMKKLKVSIVDEEVSTLIYREAEQEQMDAAVLYLAGRKLMIEPKMQTFIGDMKDRLVVLGNVEDAADPWKVESNGSDFTAEFAEGVGSSMCETFAQQSYYYSQGAFNNWQLTVFRTFPFKWEYWIEDLNSTLTLIAETDYKLNYYETVRIMSEYEEKEGVRPAQKVGKMLKDSLSMEEESNEREPGWRAMKKDF